MYTKEDVDNFIKEHGEELRVESSAPFSVEEIREAEEELDLNFPREYEEFLKSYGSLGVMGLEVFGIDEGVPLAKFERGDLDEGPARKLLDYLIPVSRDGLGNYDCLVCKGEDHGKVAFWQHDVDEKHLYPNTPEGKPDFWIEGETFWDWLYKELEQEKEIQEEIK